MALTDEQEKEIKAEIESLKKDREKLASDKKELEIALAKEKPTSGTEKLPADFAVTLQKIDERIVALEARLGKPSTERRFYVDFFRAE